MRAELEGLAAERAVVLIADVQLERLREADRWFGHAVADAIDGRRSGRPPEPWTSGNEWERANDTFHQVIQEAAGNRHLLAAIAHLHQTFPRHLTWTALGTSSHRLSENVEQHHRILAAIERRDGASARAEMATHIRSAGELIALLLERA